MIDDKTIIQLQEQAGISQASYALKQLISEGKVMESEEYPTKENMLGPYEMPNGSVKYFDKTTNTVVEAKSDKVEKPLEVERPMDNVDDIEDSDERLGKTEQQGHKVDYPKEVQQSVKKRLKELEDTLETYGNKGYNDEPGALVNAIESLNKIDEHLKEKNMESFKEAQIFYQTLMSPITNLFPAKLIIWLMADYDKMMKKED